MKPLHFAHAGWIRMCPENTGWAEIFAVVEGEPAYHFRHVSGDILPLPSMEIQKVAIEKYGPPPRLRRLRPGETPARREF